MEDQTLKRVVEDVQLIRKVMDRSSEYNGTLNKAFIWWGVSFTLIGVISYTVRFIWRNLSHMLSNEPILIIIPKVLVALATMTIFLFVSRSLSNKGLNYKLLILWLAIFGYNIIVPSCYIVMRSIFQPNYYSHLVQLDILNQLIPRYSWGSFAVGMLCMRVFAHLKFAGGCALFYIIMYAISMCVPGYTALVFNNYILPFSLLLLGILMELKIRKNLL